MEESLFNSDQPNESEQNRQIRQLMFDNPPLNKLCCCENDSEDCPNCYYGIRWMIGFTSDEIDSIVSDFSQEDFDYFKSLFDK